MKDWRIIEWHAGDPPSRYWRLCRDTNGRVLEFDSEDEARAVLHTLREANLTGSFRIHRGGLTMANITAQGHAIRPPKDLLLRILRAAQER